MGDLSTLNIVNKILRKTKIIGRTTEDLTDLTNLKEHPRLCFEVLTESYSNLHQHTTWRPLRTQGTITLVDGTNSYALPSDFRREDHTSFKYDNKRSIPKKTPHQIDFMRNDRTETGEPNYYYIEGTNFKFDKIPTSAEDGKTIVYYYYKVPTSLSTSDPTATTWVPNGYDDTVLTNWAVYRILLERERDLALFYNSLYEKSLNDMERDYEDPLDEFSEYECYTEGFLNRRPNINSSGVNISDYGHG